MHFYLELFSWTTTQFSTLGQQDNVVNVHKSLDPTMI
jgi:hypothetical protein